MFDDVQIVLYNNYGRTAFNELVKGIEEFGNIVKVEAGSRFVENVKVVAVALSGKMGS